MKKRQASNSQAKRAQIAAAKKAKRDRVAAEFRNGDWQRTKRAEEAKRKRRLIQTADNLAMLALLGAGMKPERFRP